jgi:hypothetical protein
VAILIQDDPALLSSLREARKQVEELGQQGLNKETRKRLLALGKAGVES